MNPIQLELTLDEINVVLEALGRRPFARVHQIIAKIHHQATSQLDGTTGPAILNVNEQS